LRLFTFQSKLPVTDAEREWVDRGFERLERLLGRRRMLDAPVVLPDEEHFPDYYDESPAAAEKLFQRVCRFMHVNHRTVMLEVFPDETDELQKLLPYWQGHTDRCAGLFVHKPETAESGDSSHERMVVAIRSTQLKDPLALVGTIAHELGHVILLGGGLLAPDTPDHEPLTDLLTVFLGVGIFSANSAGRFRQYQDEMRYGWSMERLGYLSQEVYGYALAKFAMLRGEENPAWIKHLSLNVRAYCKRSLSWLARNTGQYGMSASV
jgi:hypothetical protein